MTAVVNNTFVEKMVAIDKLPIVSVIWERSFVTVVQQTIAMGLSTTGCQMIPQKIGVACSKT